MDSELPEGMLPAEAGIEQTADAGERLMTYQAVLLIVVPDVEAALQSTQAQAAGMGGYMQGMTGRSLTVRVPAARFQELLAWIERMGEVTSRQITSADVTEELLDLDIRLATLRELLTHCGWS